MMAKIYPYLMFENAKEALTYYEEVFGATNIARMQMTPDQEAAFDTPVPNLEDSTIHGTFSVLGADLFCSDTFGKSLAEGNNISLLLDINSEDEIAAKAADDFYDKVLASNTVKLEMPYAEQFWGGKMGQFTDKYGIQWMLHSQPYSKIKQK